MAPDPVATDVVLTEIVLDVEALPEKEPINERIPLRAILAMTCGLGG